MSNNYDLFIVGAGIAGLTAGEEAARRGLRVAIAEKAMFGGLVVNINQLKPVPEGYPVSGSDLAADLMTKISEMGVEMVFEPVASISVRPDDMMVVSTSGGDHETRCVVVASGASFRKLGIPGETEFEHKGVSSCADCDGPIYMNAPVAVIGGGDSALQEALVLADFCSVVHLVHRRECFSGRSEFVEAVRSEPRIKVHPNTVAEALEGDDTLSRIRLRDTVSGRTVTEDCKGFFAYIGLKPNTDFLPGAIVPEDGLLPVDRSLETKMKNVFAIGAVRSGYSGDLSDAIGDAKSAVSAISERLGKSGCT